ncbi:putative leader peptide [Streptomyces sp. NPDC058274]|uniref:putative leader peptide n=1 Tax=Streptomyces sp. NPDC058274 TaxID=3346416 RepID=UPI0036E3F7AA
MPWWGPCSRWTRTGVKGAPAVIAGPRGPATSWEPGIHPPAKPGRGAGAAAETCWGDRPVDAGGRRPGPHPGRPHSDGELNRPHGHGVLRIVTDTCVHLWRRVHMDLLRYAGCVCRPSR